MACAAERDPLNHPPDRVLLIDRFARAIASARRHGGRVALPFVDLDNFDEVNDALGHGVVDEVRKCVARGLATAVPEADTVSLQGGDEFLVRLTDIVRHADAVRIAEKPRLAMSLVLTWVLLPFAGAILWGARWAAAQHAVRHARDGLQRHRARSAAAAMFVSVWHIRLALSAPP